MFDPSTLPTEMPIVSGFKVENIATKSSGREVEKATSMNPVFVFPKPVTLANLTELVIAKLLAFIKTASDAMRTAMFPTNPNCSSNPCSFFGYKILFLKLIYLDIFLFFMLKRNNFNLRLFRQF